MITIELTQPEFRLLWTTLVTDLARLEKAIEKETNRADLDHMCIVHEAMSELLGRLGPVAVI